MGKNKAKFALKRSVSNLFDDDSRFCEISISSIILCQYLNDRYLVCVNSLISKQNVLVLSIFIDSSGSDVFQGIDRLMY